MKKTLLFSLILTILIGPAFAITIDGKPWDWIGIGVFHYCSPRILEKDRSGIDMQKIKMCLGAKYLYIYIEGRSVAGQKVDRGWGAKKTSFRVSFNSAQSPLNRVRVAEYPDKPGQIKISCPGAESKMLGSKKNRFWAMGKYGSKYVFEIKIPFYYSAKGIHVGAAGGPLIRLSRYYASGREHLSDVLINSVDMKTHRLVDTAVFSIRKGQL